MAREMRKLFAESEKAKAAKADTIPVELQCLSERIARLRERSAKLIAMLPKDFPP